MEEDPWTYIFLIILALQAPCDMLLDKVLHVAAVYSTAHFAVLWWMNPDVNLLHLQLLSSSLGHTQAGYASVPSMYTTSLGV